VVARDGAGRKVARSVTSCAECLAWGMTYCQGTCLACYNFAARYHGNSGACGACRRVLPLRSGYCRLCWCQARHDRDTADADARSSVVLAPWLAQVRHHQLFFARMESRRARPRMMPRRYGAKGRPRKLPPAVAARPASYGVQLALYAAPPARDYARAAFDLRGGAVPGNAWLDWALRLSWAAGEARGWQPGTRRALQRVLVMLLAGHRDGETIPASAVHALARRHSVSAQCAEEIVTAMGILADDRPGLFARWLDARLTGLPAGVARETRRWALTLHDGGPRASPRSPHTARAYVRAALPALLAWASAYEHLREVTRDDVVSYLAGLHGHDRYQAVAALRSLFTWARKAGVIFRNPATRIRLGKRDLPVWQPLAAADLAAAAAAAAPSPQARVCVVLAAVHAARPGAIRALQLDDVDLAAQRLRLAGASRPMGELTCKVLREWLEFRQQRWPGTSNPHLLVSKESALHHGPVSTGYLTSLRGLPATLERLRIDCQLAEAMATGFDPLHLAGVFGISEQTAIRYAVNARQLTGPLHQAAAPSSPATPGRSCQDGRATPLGSS
jgi:Phage integrase, N-terminal SAM-like domain